MRCWIYCCLFLKAFSFVQAETIASTLAFYPPFKEDTNRLRLDADYLLLAPSQESLIIAADNFYPYPYDKPTQGMSYEPSYPFLSGLRFTLDATLSTPAPLDWKLTFSWLCPHRKEGKLIDTSSIYTFPLYAINPAVPLNLNNLFVIDLTTTFTTDYAVLDFEWVRPTYLTKSFVLLPSLGFRGTWQTQQWNSNLYMFTHNPLTSTYFYNFTQNFWGIGIKEQLSSKWILWKMFSLVFNSALSQLYTPMSLYTQFSARASGATDTYYNNSTTLHTLTCVIDLSAGITLDWLDLNTLGIETLQLHALWETQSWLQVNKMLLSIPDVKSGDTLSLQGISIGMGLLF